MRKMLLAAGPAAADVGGSGPADALRELVGGQGGIRTRGGCYTTHAFQACALNHSATCPQERFRRSYSLKRGPGNGLPPGGRLL